MGDDCKIYVGSLSYKTDDESLTRHFKGIGDVVDARVVYDRDSGKSRGFGFVTFSDATHVDLAIEKLTDSDLDGRQIKVSKANSRSSQGGGGYRGRGGGRGGGFGGRGGSSYGQRYQGGGGGGYSGGSHSYGDGGYSGYGGSGGYGYGQ